MVNIMSKDIFDRIIEETKSNIKSEMKIDLKKEYVSALMSSLMTNADSSAVNEIIKNKEKCFNISYTEKLIQICKDKVLTCMDCLELTEGRKITLWNQIMFAVELPDIKSFVLDFEFKTQGNNNFCRKSDDSNVLNYALDAVFVAAALAGVFIPMPVLPRIVLITGGTIGAVMQTVRIAITNKSEKNIVINENVHLSEEIIFGEYMKQIENNCEYVVSVFEKWLDALIDKSKEIVGCEE